MVTRDNFLTNIAALRVVKFCLNTHSLPWMFAKCENPVYDMWFLGTQLTSYFDALDELSHMWTMERGFKVIIAKIKEPAILVKQGRIFNYMTRR